MSELSDKLKTTKVAAAQSTALVKSTDSVLNWINAPTTSAEIARALPRGLDEARFARVIQTELRKNPALLESDPQSFILAVLTAAQLGLFPGPLGHAYLTGPFRNSKTGKKETVLILGYKGLMDLAYRSNTVDLLDSVPVHEGEPFKVIRGSDQRLIHEEVAESQEKPIVAYYAIAFPKGSSRAVFEVMYPYEIAAVRKRSRAANDGPWMTDFEPMALKTPMRRMLNRGKVRLTADVAEAIALDEAREFGLDRPDVLGELPKLEAPIQLESAKNGDQTATDAPAATPAPSTPEPSASLPSKTPSTSEPPAGSVPQDKQGKLI